MSMADLHDLAEKLHKIDEELRLNAVEIESVRLTRRLAMSLVREMDWLSQRMDRLEGKPSVDVLDQS
jgi:predicted thioredoxin/glutaredoxin